MNDGQRGHPNGCAGLSEFWEPSRLRSSWFDALKRLEYRGYDSAGVATLDHGVLGRRRAEGKLRSLETRLDREPLGAISGSVTHAGPRMAVPQKTMLIRTRPTSSRSFTTASSKIFASCANS